MHSFACPECRQRQGLKFVQGRQNMHGNPNIDTHARGCTHTAAGLPGAKGRKAASISASVSAAPRLPEMTT